MLTTDEIPLSTTAERQAVTTEAGAAPEKDWVIVTRGLKRDYDMGGEIVHALRGVDIAIRRNDHTPIRRVQRQCERCFAAPWRSP